MRKTAILATLAGLALFAWLVAREAPGIRVALSTAGWELLWVAMFHVAAVTLDSLGWLSLTRRQRPMFWSFLWTRWVAESLNSLLPVAQVGGHAVRAVLIAGQRLPLPRAIATVMVDFTIGLGTQLLFSLLGMILLLSHLGGTAGMLGLASLGTILLLLTGFYLAQKKGLFTFAVEFTRKHISSHQKVVDLGGSARHLDALIAAVYRNGPALLACAFFRLGGWLTKAGETMLTLYLLGHPVSYADALIIESLSNALASAAFIFPGGLGVREGGILLLGSLLGLPPDIALALAVVRRGRELVLGLPGLLPLLASRLWRKKLDLRPGKR